MSAAAATLNGYAQSKLVSELLCWDAAAVGLPVAIYRPGIISSHRENGYCRPDDFYPRLLKAIVNHGIYPAVRVDATFDMTPLEWVSRGVTNIASRYVFTKSKFFQIATKFQDTNCLRTGHEHLEIT